MLQSAKLLSKYNKIEIQVKFYKYNGIFNYSACIKIENYNASYSHFTFNHLYMLLR